MFENDTNVLLLVQVVCYNKFEIKEDYEFMENERKFGINLGKIVLGDSNFLVLDEPTLVIAKKNEVLENVSREIVFNTLENIDAMMQVFSFGKVYSFAKSSYITEKEVKRGLVEVYNYIKTVNTFLKLNRCKSVSEYNKKFRKNTAKVLVLLSNLEKFKLLDNYSELEPLVRFIISNAKTAGVLLVATTTSIENMGLGDELFLKFNNRLIFNGVDGCDVQKLSLGMYNTTRNLSDLECYYMTGNIGNGSKISISPQK